jgi:mannosyltransferase OCH1-like enzyme
MTIPHLIHMLWMDPTGEDRDLPPDSAANVQAWRDLHPSAVVRVWNPYAAINLVPDVDVIGAINACRFEAMKSDVLRLAILYAYGGVWSDLKCLPLRESLSALCESDTIPTFVEHWPGATRPDPKGWLINSIIATPPKNPLILAMLQEVCDNIANRMTASVFRVSGADAMMHHLRRSRVPSDQYRVLPYGEVWGVLVKRTPATYNAGAAHWSLRQKTEALYQEHE